MSAHLADKQIGTSVGDSHGELWLAPTVDGGPVGLVAVGDEPRHAIERNAGWTAVAQVFNRDEMIELAK